MKTVKLSLLLCTMPITHLYLVLHNFHETEAAWVQLFLNLNNFLPFCEIQAVRLVHSFRLHHFFLHVSPLLGQRLVFLYLLYFLVLLIASTFAQDVVVELDQYPLSIVVRNLRSSSKFWASSLQFVENTTRRHLK